MIVERIDTLELYFRLVWCFTAKVGIPRAFRTGIAEGTFGWAALEDAALVGPVLRPRGATVLEVF